MVVETISGQLRPQNLSDALGRPINLRACVVIVVRAPLLCRDNVFYNQRMSSNRSTHREVSVLSFGRQGGDVPPLIFDRHFGSSDVDFEGAPFRLGGN